MLVGNFTGNPPAPSPVGCAEFPDNYRVGLEFELENLPHAERPGGWRIIHDSSLRNNGVEFVFDGAVGGRALNNRLQRLSEVLEQAFPPPVANNRCSTHVHLDVRDMEISQLVNLLYISIVLEYPLAMMCGGRIDNAYCILDSHTNSRTAHAIGKYLREPAMAEFIRSITRGCSKYRALNTLPITTQGSVEYRHAGGYSAPREAVPWIKTVLALKGWAMQYTGGISELHGQIMAGWYGQIMDSVGVPHLKQYDPTGIHMRIGSTLCCVRPSAPQDRRMEVLPNSPLARLFASHLSDPQPAELQEGVEGEGDGGMPDTWVHTVPSPLRVPREDLENLLMEARQWRGRHPSGLVLNPDLPEDDNDD